MARNLRTISATIPATPTQIATTPRLVLVNPQAEYTSVLEEFYFPFAPTNITYENLAPEYIEISRPQNQAIVGLAQYKLMKVNLQFLIAKPQDGMFTTVDQELRVLRSFANSESPVAFINMDGMLTNPFNVSSPDVFRTKRESSAFFFRIVDLSVSSTRRNTNNEITAAEVTMSLLEVNNPILYLANFARIKYPKTVKPKKKKKKKKKDGPARDAYGKPRININEANK